MSEHDPLAVSAVEQTRRFADDYPRDAAQASASLGDATVYVVDPDDHVRETVRCLAQTMNLRCAGFASGVEFLDTYSHVVPGCAILEVRIPSINGLDIQRRLIEGGATLPVIFLSAQATISIAVRAMRAGAVHFLEKPVREHELWDAIQEALRLDEAKRRLSRQHVEYHRRASRLNAKEQRVLELIANGSSKQAIARELDVCVRTVELRRSQLMKKLGVASAMELVQFALLSRNGDSTAAINGNGKTKPAPR